jgi:signal transduction histidine kinase
MRVFVWLSLPIAFQLHWRFPIPFRFSKKWINVTSYSLIIIIAVLEILTPDAGNYFLIAFLITLISSFTILVIKYFKFKPYRKILLTIIFAYFLAVLPLALLGIKLLTGSVTVKRNFALLGLSAIPGFYFFIGYRIHMKRYNPKVLVAQRLFTLGVLLVFLMNFLIQSLPTAVNPLISSIVAFLTTIFISFTGFGALLIMPALADDQVNLFKTETYTLRMSANRASAFIIFLLVIGAITLTAMFFITSRIDSSIAASFLATLLSLSLTVITILLYKPYRKYFNRIILGIRRSPDELIRGYAHSIITSLDWDSLAILIKEEILPSLLIRESVLFYIQDNSRIMTLFKTGLTNTVVSQMQADLSLHIKDLHNVAIPETITHKYPWVRVTLPLEINGVKKGFWFFGQRDPNNIYNTEFIKDLSSLANQTTLALLNIHQAELLQSLYSANVNRQEEEKATIARDLHDALLPSIGYLVELQENNRDIEEFEHAVQRINTMIRNIMSGLRPATLDLGLAIALEELADEPVAQIGGAINIKTHLAIPEPVAYPKNVELHLYRMVQQASQNALEHARAEEILIHGTLLPNSLDLHVEDNGIGFQLTGSPDLSGLISQQHFGLANIFERAKIINADVKIDSQLNQGTSIHIHWSLQNDPKTG